MSNLIQAETSENEAKWQNALVQRVGSILERIVQPSNLIDNMLSAENVSKLLVPAFTHETYNPNINFHGQRLEYLNDRSLKSIFSEYMYSRFPTIDESAFTEFENAYMSNKYQSGLADRLGISEFVRSRGYEKIELSLKADVFESFCAFVVRAGNSISGENSSYGLGFNFLRNLVIYLFNDVEFDIDRAAGSPKTRFDQLFGVRDAVQTHLNNDGTTTVRVILDNNKIRSIESKDTETAKLIKQYLAEVLKSNIIGTGTSRSEKVADRKAFDLAMKTLRKAGLTNERYETIK
jgi:hypothetical protein